MASKCFYRILHSSLFIITVFVVQVLSDPEPKIQKAFTITKVATRSWKEMPGRKKKSSGEENTENSHEVRPKQYAYPNFDKFDPNEETFAAYLERFHFYLDAYNVPVEKWKAILITCLGPGTYTQLRKLTVPETPQSLTYEQIDGHYLINNAQEDFDISFVPLAIERRQVNQNDKKPEVPIEDKGKLTKKPTALDTKTTPPTVPEPGAEKLPLGFNKKDPPVKSINATVLQSEPHDNSKPSGVRDKLEDRTSDGTPHSDISILHSTTTAAPVMTTKVYNKASSASLTNISVPDPDIQITKMPDGNLEETIKKHNLTEKQDTHLYYNSSFVVDPELGQKYWVDLDKQSNVKISDVLSQAYRRAMTVKLSFDFPFYGHLIRNITIATGGFLYTGDYVHSWLAATQYIAPLMANFDTSLSNNSFVKYVDNGTAFTVQWENVILQEKPKHGGFTFQCTLHKNGDIVFVYQQVAVVIESIDDDQHPVKVGLSDAYIIDRTIFFVRRKTIYEYHRVNFSKEDIKNWTVIVLNALETCLDMKECNSCLTKLRNFKCNWCANRCSNGLDRHRQDWITNGCEKVKIKSAEECGEDYVEDVDSSRSSSLNMLSGGGKGVNIGIAGILGILFIVCLGLGSGIWLFYAYRNPHTPAGQFLIRCRPSQWSWRRGEARYTAATIHM